MTDGLPLAIDEQTGATLWPRERYPSADDALAAHVSENGLWDEELGTDLEAWDARHVRLVWAAPAPHVEHGWWDWTGRPTPGLVECWEVA